jgi:type IV pilus assembly protein PilN
VLSVTGEQAKLNGVIHQPENETVLERSVFLNSLLLRKGISWNQIFTDLEKTIPYNVKITRISPSVDDQGRVTLDMILASDTSANVLKALIAFDDNPLFGSVVPKNTIPPTQTEPLYRLNMAVTYAQKL